MGSQLARLKALIDTDDLERPLQDAAGIFILRSQAGTWQIVTTEMEMDREFPWHPNFTEALAACEGRQSNE